MGNPIQIDDLWALKFGTQTTGGTNTLLFSAGINDEKDGLVGAIKGEGLQAFGAGWDLVSSAGKKVEKPGS